VVDISAVEVNYGDYWSVIFGVAQKGSSKVSVFMYATSNYQMLHIFTVNLPKGEDFVPEGDLVEDSDISRTAMKLQFTKQAQHCIVTLWNGDILVYALPPLPVLNDCFSNIDFTSTHDHALRGGQAIFLTPEFMGETVKPPPPKNNFVEKLFARNLSDVHLRQVKDPLMIIPGRFPQKEFDIEKLQEKFAEQVITQEEEVNDKRFAKGARKPNQAEKIVEEVLEEKDTIEFHQNPKILFGHPKSAKPSAMPEYYPLIHLIEESVQVNPAAYFDYPLLDAYYNPPSSTKVDDDSKIRLHKTMSKSKRLTLTTKFVIAWANNIFFESYSLQAPTPINFPIQYTKNFLFFSKYSTQPFHTLYTTSIATLQASTLLHPTTFHLTSKIFEKILFYPIKCTAVTSKAIYLAIGCLDGTIILWDLQLATIKSTLDRHQKGVSCLCFYDQWLLCSGGLDGHVH
jgi:hypothetical protein